MTKFSIIVPVYNAEKYLSKCLDSLVNQTYTDIEIICVNDGSTDSSLPIMEKYAQKDNRIKIINQENQGVSVARNSGLKIITGDYFLFVDSDDFLNLNACEILDTTLLNKDIDLLFFGYQRLKNNKNFYTKSLCCIKEPTKMLDIDYEVLDQLSLRPICGKLYKTSLVNNIYFEQNLNYGEDTLFVVNCLIKNPKVASIDNKIYYYNIGITNSLTKQCNNKKIENIYLLIKEFNKLFQDKNYANNLKNYIYDDTFNLIALEHADSLFLNVLNCDLLLNQINEFYNCFNVNELQKFKGYKRIKRYKLFYKYHLLWIYLRMLRPIGKYCIVLPYRRIKSFLRAGRG